MISVATVMLLLMESHLSIVENYSEWNRKFSVVFCAKDIIVLKNDIYENDAWGSLRSDVREQSAGLFCSDRNDIFRGSGRDSYRMWRSPGREDFSFLPTFPK